MNRITRTAVRFLCFVMLAALFAPGALAAITVTATRSSGLDVNGWGGASLTWDPLFTFTPGNGVLVVMIAGEHYSGTPTVTYDGVALTMIAGSTAGHTGGSAWIYALANPASSGGSLVVNTGGGVRWGVAALYLDGAKIDDALSAFNQSSSASSLTATLPSAPPAGSIVVSVGGTGAAAFPIPSPGVTGSTRLMNLTGFGSGAAADYLLPADGTTSYSTTYDGPANDGMTVAIASFAAFKANPTLSVDNSPQVYTGSAIAATVNGSVAGTVSDVKYDGSSTVPTAVDTYAVTADFVPTDTANYNSLSDASAGNFVINKANPTVSVGNSPQVYTGSPIAATVNGSVAGTVSDVKYDGSSTVPTAAGTYAVTADFVPTDTVNYNSLSDASAGDFVIDPANPTLSVGNSPVTFNGSPQSATVNGTVAGTATDVKYNNSLTVPTAAGTYAVTADFVPTDTVNYNSLSDASAGDFVISPLSLRPVAEAELQAETTEVGTAKMDRAAFNPVFTITDTGDYPDGVDFSITTPGGVLSKTVAPSYPDPASPYYVMIQVTDDGDPVGNKMLIEVTVVSGAVPGTIFMFR